MMVKEYYWDPLVEHVNVREVSRQEKEKRAFVRELRNHLLMFAGFVIFLVLIALLAVYIKYG